MFKYDGQSTFVLVQLEKVAIIPGGDGNSIDICHRFLSAVEPNRLLLPNLRKYIMIIKFRDFLRNEEITFSGILANPFSVGWPTPKTGKPGTLRQFGRSSLGGPEILSREREGHRVS